MIYVKCQGLIFAIDLHDDLNKVLMATWKSLKFQYIMLKGGSFNEIIIQMVWRR